MTTSRRRAGGALAALALLLAAGLALPAAARADAPTVTSFTVDAPDRLTVGDHFRVSITVEADSGTRVRLAPGGLPPEVSLAETPSVSSRAKGGGRTEVRLDLVLAAFVVGDYQMPGLTLSYTAAGGVSGTLQTPATHLSIASTLPAGGPLEPRPLKPQADIGAAGGAPSQLVALAAAAFMAAAALLYFVRRRLTRPAPEAAVLPEPQALGPEDQARRRLDGAAARFGSDRDYAAYYQAIASVVRGYLTDRFGFPAFALTTAELQRQMVARGLDRWQARLAGGLLEQCDAVLYAGYRPALERADADLTAAYEIVEMSRPAPQQLEVALA
jgi:hypothetical protein